MNKISQLRKRADRTDLSGCKITALSVLQSLLAFSLRSTIPTVFDEAINSTRAHRWTYLTQFPIARRPPGPPVGYSGRPPRSSWIPQASSTGPLLRAPFNAPIDSCMPSSLDPLCSQPRDCHVNKITSIVLPPFTVSYRYSPRRIYAFVFICILGLFL